MNSDITSSFNCMLDLHYKSYKNILHNLCLMKWKIIKNKLNYSINEEPFNSLAILNSLNIEIKSY